MELSSPRGNLSELMIPYVLQRFLTLTDITLFLQKATIGPLCSELQCNTGCCMTEIATFSVLVLIQRFLGTRGPSAFIFIEIAQQDRTIIFYVLSSSLFPGNTGSSTETENSYRPKA